MVPLLYLLMLMEIHLLCQSKVSAGSGQFEALKINKLTLQGKETIRSDQLYFKTIGRFWTQHSDNTRSSIH